MGGVRGAAPTTPWSGSVLQRGAGLTFSLGLGLLLLASAVAFALLVADRIAAARR